MNQSQRLSRTKLYELVWESPMQEVARQLGISDVGLKKICVRHEIPTPSCGYWQRKQSGAIVRVPVLRALNESEKHLEHVRVDGRQVPLEESRPEYSFEVMRLLQRLKEEEACHVSGSIGGNQSALIEHAEVAYRSFRRLDDGRIVPRKKRCMRFPVSESLVDRSLGCAGQLFQALGSVGVEITADSSTDYQPIVELCGQKIRLFFEEETKQIAPGIRSLQTRVDPVTGEIRKMQTKGEFGPTGILVCRLLGPQPITGRKRWRDIPRKKLEDQIWSIANGIVTAAERTRLTTIATMKRQREWEEDRRQRWEAQRRRDAVDVSTKRLLQSIESWAAARRIDEFFTDVEERIGRLSGEDRDLASERRQLARVLVGETDALKGLIAWSSPDELLEDASDSWRERTRLDLRL